MISTCLSRKWIAAFVAVAVLSVYSMVVLASPGAKASGELSVSGQVTVNGQKVSSGGTLFSDSLLTTAEKSSATVSISKLGRVELAPNSNLHLSFSENNLSGLLENGTAHVSTLAGVKVNITTKDGLVVVDGTNATSFTVDATQGTVVSTEAGVADLRAGGTVKHIAAGENAVAGTPQGTTQGGCRYGTCPDQGLSSGALAALLIAGGGAIAAAIWALTRNNDLNFNSGPVVVISPTK